MPRYFFNIRRNHLSDCDLRGEQCSGPAEAVDRAAVEALALVIQGNRVRDWTDWAIDIEDEARNRVATVPVDIVLGRPKDRPGAAIRRDGQSDRPARQRVHGSARRLPPDDGRKDHR